MRTHPGLTKENLQKLYVEQKLPMKEVARSVGASKHGVQNALHRFGLSVRNGHPHLTKTLLKKLYVKEKLSTREVAKRLGASDAGVYKALKRFNIKVRSTTKAANLRGGMNRHNWKKLAKKYRAGTPLDEIADEVGCAWSTASAHLSKHTKIRTRGAETNRPNSRSTIKFDVDKAIKMNKEGMTLTEIGARLGKEIGRPLSVQVLCHRFKKVGYKTLVHKASKDKFRNLQADKRAVAHAIGADKCVVCPETRGVQLCHIKAKRFGGKLVSGNVVALCPNHHFFFDHGYFNRRELCKVRSYLVGAATNGYQHHHYPV